MSRIAVVGAGIIGSSVFAWLIGDGHEVTVYEREPHGLPASAGNASLIVRPEISAVQRPAF
jgi:D-amino-acid dehydrogenase